MPKALRAGVAGALAGALALTTPAAAAPTPTRRARIAVRYVVSQQGREGRIRGGSSKLGTTADAVTALVAARRGARALRRALSYLRTHGSKARTVGLKARLVLALVAAGRDPRAFAGRDWIAEIEGAELPAGDPAAGRYGRRSRVLGHARALLALTAAGVTPSDAAARWLAQAQCPDGGWQRDGPRQTGENLHCQGNIDRDPYRSEADASGLAVQALARFGPGVPAVDPFTFFPTLRDPVKGGWGYSHTRPRTNAASTALVLQAYATRRRTPARGPRALRRLQYALCGADAGAFPRTWKLERGRYRRTGPDVDATIASIPALLGQTLPVAHAPVTKRAPRAPTC
jgi:hypothetical protein